jgi:ABC-2 type transport system ATP-binding protein
MADDGPQTVTNAQQQTEMEADSEPVIETHGVKKQFGSDDDSVLRDIDLAIPPGKTTVVMGPNGGGKSVLLACFASGLHPSAGELHVFGEDPSTVSSQLCFLLQDVLAIPQLSGQENLEYYAALRPAATDAWRPFHLSIFAT